MGGMGLPPSPPQPGPLMWVSENPRNVLSPWSYPPPSCRFWVSGLHWIIPNGTSAPGNVLNPPAVPMNGSTSAAGSATSAGRIAASAGTATAPRPASRPTAKPALSTALNPCRMDLPLPGGHGDNVVSLCFRPPRTGAQGGEISRLDPSRGP